MILPLNSPKVQFVNTPTHLLKSPENDQFKVSVENSFNRSVQLPF